MSLPFMPPRSFMLPFSIAQARSREKGQADRGPRVAETVPRQGAGNPARIRPMVRASLQETEGRLARATINKIEMAQRLVAFDTTSRNSNLALIEFIADYLDSCGLKSELVFNPERTK